MIQYSDVIEKPQFLKFIDVYAKKFIANNGFGRWLHEYKDMVPAILFQRLYDVKILRIEILLDIIHESHQFFVLLAFYLRFGAMFQVIVINMASHISNDISYMSLALLEKEISIT